MGIRCIASSVLALAAFTSANAQQAPARLDVDWGALKEESEARKAAADARKAEADADAAAAKAEFGGLADASTQGTTTAGDKAGQIEAAILSNAATRKVAIRIVSDVCARAPSLCSAAPARALIPQPVPATACAGLDGSGGSVRLYIVTEAEKPTFDNAETVHASLCGLQRRLEKAISASDRLRNRGVEAVIAPAAIFAIANVVGNLFRSDYVVQGVAITPDDLLLAKTVAAAAGSAVKVPILLPSVYRPAALTSDNPLVSALTAIDQLRAQAAGLSVIHRRSAASTGGKGRGPAGRAAVQTAVASELEAAIKAYDEYLAKITTPSEKGVSELAEAARQARIRADLQAGSYLLAVKMNAAGGSSFTTKNFWTFLGGVPFHVSGGAVASFTLIEGGSGAVAGAGSYGVAGGFDSIGAVHRRKDVQ